MLCPCHYLYFDFSNSSQLYVRSEFSCIPFTCFWTTMFVLLCSVVYFRYGWRCYVMLLVDTASVVIFCGPANIKILYFQMSGEKRRASIDLKKLPIYKRIYVLRALFFIAFSLRLLCHKMRNINADENNGKETGFWCGAASLDFQLYFLMNRFSLFY